MNQNYKNNNSSSSSSSNCCYYHRKETVIGICALCLNERLLILASKQASSNSTNNATATANSSSGKFRRNRKKKSTGGSSAVVNSYSKIFAFGSYLFKGGGGNHRLEIVDLKSGDGIDYDDDDDDCASATSHDDSFISIKFEDNGDTSWDKAKAAASMVSLEQCKVTTWNHSLRKETPKRGAVDQPLKESSTTKGSKTVIEHGKPTLRLRKKIGHLFQLIKWKRSNKTNACHVSNKAVGVKVGKSWIRTLIKRRATQ